MKDLKELTKLARYGIYGVGKTDKNQKGVKMEVELYETCLPRSWQAKVLKTSQTFNKLDTETLDQFRWRIMGAVNSGCIFIFV